MSDNKTLVLKNTNSFLDNMLKKDAEALPKGFNSLRFKQNALTVLQDTAGLEKLRGNEFTLARTLMKGAFLGLDFFNKECYCIVYGNKADFQTDYKGEKKLAKKYSVNPIKDIYAKLVREGDLFEEGVKEGQQFINFKPIPFNTAPIIGVFAVVYFQDGSMMYETMSKEEVDYIRDTFSKQPKGATWTKSYGEMAKKTVLRRLCKHIELDFDTLEQRKAWEDGADVNFNNKSEEKEVEKSIFDMDTEEEKKDTDTVNEPDFIEADYEEANNA